MSWKLPKLVTGGQTGVDRACLDFALQYEIKCGGWCPRGRLAEDGVIDECYPLVETASDDVAQRTEWNARDSDATLLLSCGEPKDGTMLTVEMAERYGKPVHIVDIEKTPDIQAFSEWMSSNTIEVLNVAGPRESHSPGVVYSQTRKHLTALFSNHLS